MLAGVSRRHYIRLTTQGGEPVARLKDETLSIRTSAEVKELLKLAAEREHRSVASMMEVLVLAYAQQHKLKASSRKSPSA